MATKQRNLVGRTKEKQILDKALNSKKAELIAVYGRRRVGKTYLVRHHGGQQAATYLEITGSRDTSAQLQRIRFRESLINNLGLSKKQPEFNSWEDAFQTLADLVHKKSKKSKAPILIFFDELPWLASPRSRLLTSLGYIWNTRLSKIPNLTVVLCGSAASWMIRRIVHAKGGLHNRLTGQIQLAPFTLKESDEFLRSKRIRLSPHELLELYMAIGGVPYYQSLVPRGRSVPEIVGELCFEQGSPLQSEFENIFASLFDHHEEHIEILKALATKRSGLTRNQLIALANLSSGGGLNRKLQELEESGFIARTRAFGAKTKNATYRVIDEFTLFYLKWIAGASKGVLARGGSRYWQNRTQTPSYLAWTGYAFENIGLKHILELQRSLKIENLVTEVGTWQVNATANARSSSQQDGAQIDLLMERRDKIIHLCEFKFSSTPYVVTKPYARELKQKIQIFEERSKTKHRILVTLVAPHELKRNIWSEDLIDHALDIQAFMVNP